MKRSVTAIGLVLFTVFTLSAGGRQEPPPTDLFSIGVFVPGVVEGSPTYEMLVAGVGRAVAETARASVRVIEGGFNQAQWEQTVVSMAATGDYDLIVTSNPEMPDVVRAVLASFPTQRFLILDAHLADNPMVHTVMFNQREQAFLAGHFAALVSTSPMVERRSRLRAGLLAGQEYPIMNDVILPSFELGLRSVDPDATVDFRVLGNWFDAGRAAELANSMFATGSDVVLTIAGGGNQGVIAAARDRRRFVLWYDTPGYSQAPGIVIGSTYVALDRAAFERTVAAIDGTLEYGRADVLGVADGYVGFVEDDPLFRRHVDASVRDALRRMLERFESGEFSLDVRF